MNRQLIVAVGQFPPPLSGFSYITSQMVAAFSENANLIACDIAAQPGTFPIFKPIKRLLKTFRAWVILGVNSRRAGRTCYVACEGGLGQIYTLAVVAAARFGGYRILLHHHSFAYIDRPRRLMSLIMKMGGKITHIFLCESMRDRFEMAYQRIVQSTVISNAAFVGVDTVEATASEREILTVGHLSNLTREKGLYIFIDLIRECLKKDIDIRGVLAGPVDRAEDRIVIEDAVKNSNGAIIYLGPLYGDDKISFYRSIDVFVFPTQYVNEAQPTVIFEAQASGCEIISYNRGCIDSQLGGDGVLVETWDDFVKVAVNWLSGTRGRDNRIDRRLKFAERRMQAQTALAELSASLSKRHVRTRA